MSSLTIISHTEHYTTVAGSVVGLGPTVTEINHLLEVFDHIIHVAMLHEGTPPPGFISYTATNISFIPLPPVGGPKLTDKFAIVLKAPHIIATIKKAIARTDYFQFRAPTGMGVFIIPYLIYLSNAKGWFKYAGNWTQAQAPLAYRFQRWVLQGQEQYKVTINGIWEDQPQHCLSFENPCLTEAELQLGQHTIGRKTLECPLELCFVGRLEPAKGVDFIIEAIAALDDTTRSKIAKIHLVGDGALRAAYAQQVKAKALPIIFHGYLSRAAVHEIYIRSHAILLPSASEGFPKVIAEAMNYGCLPIVSDISSIGHYLKHDQSGFLLDSINTATIVQQIHTLLALSVNEFTNMIQTANSQSHKFSYNYYNQQILNQILRPDQDFNM